MTRRPVLIELGDVAELSPAEAPPVPSSEGAQGEAMQRLVALAGLRHRSWPVAIFLGALSALLALALLLAVWNFVAGVLMRNQVLGAIVVGLVGVAGLSLVVIVLREWLGVLRLARIDRLRGEAEAALAGQDLECARRVVERLLALYAGRPEGAWGAARVAERQGDVLDVDGLFGLAEVELLAPFDALAQAHVQAAARQVASVTAIVPLALADVVVALAANLRMIRRIAETYGGRAGALGSWRLTRSVFAHLLATGAVAVGDDMLGSLAGGGLLAKLSRRFGEGVVNGALTARVGVAAIEVCRPVPFRQTRRPRVAALLKRALTGMFG